MRGRNLPQEFADITLTVFWRARPNKALVRIAFEKDRLSTIELVNLPLYWPRRIVHTRLQRKSPLILELGLALIDMSIKVQYTGAMRDLVGS